MADPLVIVCAWCRYYGRAQAMARLPQSQEWRAFSYEDARAKKREGVASHGICPACRLLAAREWGLVLEPLGSPAA